MTRLQDSLQLMHTTGLRFVVKKMIRNEVTGEYETIREEFPHKVLAAEEFNDSAITDDISEIEMSVEIYDRRNGEIVESTLIARKD